MERRELITLLGGAATWPLAARAQQAAVPVVGFLHGGSRDRFPFWAAFSQGLNEVGYVEGRNVVIESRWAEDQYERLPALAADLVRRQVAVIVTGPPTAVPLAAKVATAAIPIVFFGGFDPIRVGFVASYNRPGGTMTGVISMNGDLETKRLGILQELVPAATLIAFLISSTSVGGLGDEENIQSAIAEVQTAASTLGKQVLVLKADTGSEIDGAFAALVQQKAGAVLVSTAAIFSQRANQIAELATRYRIPTMFFYREFAATGGLISYGTSRFEAWRQVGVYSGRILKGEKPADLPVMRPTKFELSVNLKTAKALGLTVPPTLLAIADEVIE